MTKREVEVPRSLAVASALSWRFLVVVAATAVIVFALVTLRLIVLPAFVAILISTLLVPLARRLRAAGLPSLVATWLTFAGALGLIALIGFLVIPPVIDQVDEVGAQARKGLEDALAWLTEGPLNLTRAEVDGYVEKATSEFGASSGSFVSGAFRGVYVVAEIIAGILLTLVLTFFFVKDRRHIANGLLSLFPAARRDTIRRCALRSWEALSAYVRGTAIIGLVDAAAIGIALLVVGVPLVLPLVIITFLGAFFPLIGAVVAGAFAALVALVTTGVVPALIITGVTVVVQQVEGDVLQPLVLGKAVNLHPLVILLSLTAGAIVAGIAGAFLAVPLAAVVAAVRSCLREGSELVEVAP